METDHSKNFLLEKVLTEEQEEVLDLYINNLDNIFEEMKQAEKTQVEIETTHLKRILST